MDNKIKEMFNEFKKDIEDNIFMEVRASYYKPLLDYFINLQQKNEELECDLEELTYSYNELQKQLQEKKEQCDNLIDYVNPYHYYGLNENDYH